MNRIFNHINDFIPRQEIIQLFNEMKYELLNCPVNCMEQLFSLINELKSASQRYFALKKLFWKVTNSIYNSFHRKSVFSHELIYMVVC